MKMAMARLAGAWAAAVMVALPAVVDAQGRNQTTDAADAMVPTETAVRSYCKVSADRTTNVLGSWSCTETNRRQGNSNQTHVTTTSFLFAESHTTSAVFAVNRTILQRLHMPTVVGLSHITDTSAVHDGTIVVTESSNNTITVTSVPVFRGRVAVATRSSAHVRNTRHEGTFRIAGNELRIEANEVGEVPGYGPRASLPALDDSYFFGFDGKFLVLTNAMDGRVRTLVKDKFVTQNTHGVGGRTAAVWKPEGGMATNGTSGVGAQP